jgi:hypothetical protein
LPRGREGTMRYYCSTILLHYVARDLSGLTLKNPQEVLTRQSPSSLGHLSSGDGNLLHILSDIHITSHHQDLSETNRPSRSTAKSLSCQIIVGKESVPLARKYDRRRGGESQTVDLVVRKKCKEGKGKREKTDPRGPGLYGGRRLVDTHVISCCPP